MPETNEFPNIFEYGDYRLFLDHAFHAMKARDKKFSLRFFARVAGFKAHSFLRLVIQGKSNLSPDSIDKMAKAFKFNAEQTRFFRNLVHLNQATTTEEKHHFAKAILKSQTYRKIHPLRESQYQYFACWYYSVVRELVGLPGFREDARWIAAHTIPHIQPQEAEEALTHLLKLGLLQRDENGKLIQAEKVVSTPAEVSSAFIANWHREYLKKAAESIDTVPRERRDISAVSLSFSKENIEVIKKMIAEFRKEIVQVALQESNRDALYQLNIQFFPISDVTDAESTSEDKDAA
jgi:uncharacterized protein (TIGR02147 family)